MRLFSRSFTSREVLFFVAAYLLSNVVLIKMQQRWRKQSDDELARLDETRAARAIHQQALISRSRFVRDGGAAAGAAAAAAPRLIPESQPRQEALRPPEQAASRDGEAVSDDEEVGERSAAPNAEGRPTAAPESPPEKEGSDQATAGDEEPEEPEERIDNPKEAGFKKILFWNAFFHSDDFRFGVGHQPFIENKCPVHRCVTTADKRALDDADLVMFHGPRIDGFPPPTRPRGQLYAYVQQEPHHALSVYEMDRFNGHFNLTVTHRRDSDVWLPYGKVVYDGGSARRAPRVHPKTRPRSVVWVVSHCSTPGKREWYVQELQKYIDIDVYGDCGDMQCSKDDFVYCYGKFADEYRFYLALENNHCRDYVSEKAFRPLEYNIVPVVFGGANYTELTPPHSVINVEDYPHPKDLARHLHALSNNEKAYNKYFSWKSKGFQLDLSRKGIMGQAFCELCEILHDPNYRYRNYKNLKDWWTKNVCDSWVIPRMRRKSRW